MLYRGKTALVTGGSSGIGLEFARALAGRGASLVLVARSEERLRCAAAGIESEYGVGVETMAADLSEKASVVRVGDALAGREPGVLVNNAGNGHYGRFVEGPGAEEVWDEVSLNVASAAALTRALLPGMIRRGEGAVINLSSTAAFQPVPYMAAYGAGKAFMLSFSEALWAECRGTGVRVMAVCPGAVETGFWSDWGGRDPRRYNYLTGISRPEQIAEAGLSALDSGKVSFVPGVRDRILARSIALAPRPFVARASEWVNRLKPGR
ncbi:SDR family NAD(P)-dependent oxidoreductase [Rubrobacter aplysinae]|uniref:SDR family NAD(P)-dependent oxidoreductase n=1 Tax=Rubrobacter aplysinae TaxID=909625 RepID=UPI00064BB27D|nr:SDR family oxidoreductase [Rubrobacter aplysinae]